MNLSLIPRCWHQELSNGTNCSIKIMIEGFFGKFMKNVLVLFSIVTEILFFCTPCHADRPAPPHPISAFSENNIYRIDVLPNMDFISKKTAVAVINVKKDNGYVEQSRINLVNRASPSEIFISNNGSIITVDDWYQRGYAHCVVIYSKYGVLLRDYALEDILSSDEIKAHVKRSISNRWWLRGPDRELTPNEAKEQKEEQKKMALWARMIIASMHSISSDPPKYTFSGDGNIFTLETGWGKVLRFDLITGNILK